MQRTESDKAGMHTSFYRDAVLRTAGLSPSDYEFPSGQEIQLGALGLAGETGEVVDEIKKMVYHGKPMAKKGANDKILKELGDVRWYLEYLAIAFGYTMTEIEDANVAKLAARYPDGFTTHAERMTRDEEHA